MRLEGLSGATYAPDETPPRVGGQALVYRGRCLDDGRVVALKVALDPADEGAARAAERLQAWSGHPIAGPWIVPVWDVGTWEGRAFTVMEWLPETLGARLVGRGLPERLAMTRAVVRAIDALHAAGLVHGDLKASNVLFGEDSTGPFLADLCAGPGLFSPGAAPPEQIARGASDPAWDRFAVASLAWRAVAGEPPQAPLLALSAVRLDAVAPLAAGRTVPFARAFHAGALTRATLEDRAAFDRAAPGLQALRLALEALLEPDPRRRVATLEPLRVALDEALGAAPRPRARRRRAWAAAVALPLLLARAATTAPACPQGYMRDGVACERADGHRVVYVPAGRAELGYGDVDAKLAPDAAPRVATITRPLWVEATEVTQAAWMETMGEYPMAERTWTSQGVELRCDEAVGVSLVGPMLPAVCVSWDDAIAYANARSQRDGLVPAYTTGDGVTWDRDAEGWRLPTEAEWEWLARGAAELPWAGAPSPDAICGWANLRDTSAREKWGNEVPCDDGAPVLAPVGRYRSNAWGVHDTLGNVLEWTWDRYGDVGTRPEADPAGPLSGAARAQRGGSWNHVAKGVAARYASAPDTATYVSGLRLVRYAASTTSSGPSSTNTIP